jgi:hypothetical protein
MPHPPAVAGPAPLHVSLVAIPIHPERVLVIAARSQELISSETAMTWHELVLYPIARHVGATAAQAVARFFALQWF